MMNGSFTWPAGHLRRFESVSSVGAWFCYFNAVGPRDFGSLLAQYCSAASYSGVTTVDRPGFSGAGLAKRLGEDARIVESLGCARLLAAWDTPDIRLFGHQNAFSERDAVILPFRPTFDLLRVCTTCMRLRFHSYLHQIEDFAECPFHRDVTLQYYRDLTMQPPRLNRLVGTDSRYVKVLHNQWFDSSSVLDWHTLRDRDPFGQAQCNRLIASLSKRFARLRRSAEQAGEDQAPQMLVVGPNTNALIWQSLAVARIPASRRPAQGSNDWSAKPAVWEISASREEARAVCLLRPVDFAQLQLLRNAYCNIAGIDPPWRTCRKSIVELEYPVEAKPFADEYELTLRFLFRDIMRALDMDDLARPALDYSQLDTAYASLSSLIRFTARMKWACFWNFDSHVYAQTRTEYATSAITALKAEHLDGLMLEISTSEEAVNERGGSRVPISPFGFAASEFGYLDNPFTRFVLKAPIGGLGALLDIFLLEEVKFVKRLIQHVERLRCELEMASVESASRVFQAVVRMSRSTVAISRAGDRLLVCVLPPGRCQWSAAFQQRTPRRDLLTERPCTTPESSVKVAADELQRKLDAAHARELQFQTHLATATADLAQERTLQHDAQRAAAQTQEADARAAREQVATLQQALERLTALLAANASSPAMPAVRRKRSVPAAS